MCNLKTLVESFKKTTYKKVQRSTVSYQQMLDFTTQELERYLNMYDQCFVEDQWAREIRNQIDNLIRRYHDYCIREKFGSHYVEVGAVKGEQVFEHVLPANLVRDMLIHKHLTIPQALNAPVCLVKKSSDLKLGKSGLTSRSPSNWNFFHRYKGLGSKFTTYNGQAVDLDTWTLEDHYKLFGIHNEV